MLDFTLAQYKTLIHSFITSGYRFLTFAAYLENNEDKGKIIILRHDVDRRLDRSLRTAELEIGMGICGTYYFRSREGRFPGKAIHEISARGHEIGYHYEDLCMNNGDVAGAVDSFEKNLARLRKIAIVKTICMHGSPLSKYDNREMWRTRSYRDFGIIGEPYFDIDYDKVMYLTDTGRRWDGESVSIRDKADKDRKSITEGSRAEHQLRLHSTRDIINALKNNQLPDQILLTIHPQRWTDEWVPWLSELVGQKTKNIVKSIIVKRMNNKKA